VPPAPAASPPVPAATGTAIQPPPAAFRRPHGGGRTPRRTLTATLLAVTAVTLSSTVAAAEPSRQWPRGVDVSSWQHQGGAGIDWRAVRAAGITFAFIKATEGADYTNPYFAGDRAAASAAGLAVGGYHYARPAMPRSTAVDQARHLLAATGAAGSTGRFPPVLDLETTGGLGPTDLTAWTGAFLEEVETRTGRPPILYTYRSFWTDKMANTRAFAKYPLWFAIYNGKDAPGWLPGGWRNWTYWQHTSGGTVNGIQGKVDMNVLCCTKSSLAKNADGSQSEIMKRYNSEPLLRLALGPPTRAEGPAGRGGRWRRFSNGLMFWSVSTGARQLHGPIATRYLADGGSNGPLRRPTGDVEQATAPGGQQAAFQGGRIYWHRDTGAHVVRGAILKKYLAMGGSGSRLGLPVTDEYAVTGGRESAFRFGRLHWTAATNAVDVLPAAKAVSPAASQP
jgi:GH25 family lysozyme M1 (1,4-beta-N-acetylmuramidase)